MATTAPVPTVFLLLKSKDGRKRPTRSTTPVRKGELVEELNEVIAADEFSGEHNYRVYNEPSTTFCCKITDLGLLVGAEPHYLMAVSHELRIREFHNHAKKEYVLGLKTGDVMSFRISANSKAVRGRIRYLGPVQGKKGVYLGVEIDKDDEYRGKGTTGVPYFDCGRKNAVWVSMDMVVYTPGSTGQHPSCDTTASGSSSSHSDQHIVRDNSKSPVASRRALRDDSASSKTTQPNSAFKMASKVFNYLKLEGGKPQRSKLYKKGDRVVVHSMKDQRHITATVRWTGLVQMSIQLGLPSMIFAGLELDFMIVPEVEFPDTHIDLAGYQWAQFEVKQGSTKLYIPEQLLVPEADYKKQKEQEKIAKELDMSVSHLTVGELKGVDIEGQQKIMDDAQRTAKLFLDGTIQNNEENLTTGNTHCQPSPQDYDPTAAVHVPPEDLRRQVELMKQFEQVKDNEKQAKLNSGSNQATPGIVYDPPGGRGFPQDVSQYSPLTRKAAGPQHPHNGALNFPGQVQRVQNYQRQDSGSRPGMDHDRQHYHEQQHQALPQYSHQRSSPHLAVKPPYDTQTADHHHNSNLPIPAPRCSAVEKKQQQEEIPSWLAMDAVVVVRNATKQVTGTVRFIGHVEGFDELVAGLELDEIMEGCGDGGFGKKRYFNCADGKGHFCRICDIQSLDSLCSPTPPATGEAPPPTVPVSTSGGGASYSNPLAKYPRYENGDQMAGSELLAQYIGNERGIQGHHNSCYLDSTVFGLFALSDAFDMMFLSTDQVGQSLTASSIQEEEYCKKTKQILWKGIVNPLRKHGVARYETVMELRDYLEQLGAMAGANKDEKDPEEFLNMLFKKVLHVPPFISIRRPFGVEGEYFVQLFFELDPKQNIMPFTEVLLLKMFKEQNISFTEIPSKLLLQMPRFGKDFKMYNKIFPSLTLDIASVLDPPCSSPKDSRTCWLCGTTPVVASCSQCAKEVFRADGPDVDLCNECSEKCHNTRNHKVTLAPEDVTVFSEMQLLSVICIETSHYVCFTRCGDRWLFHDSMADRVYDMYNIPCVTEVTKELNEWVYSGNVDRLMNSKSYEIPECVRRFTQDGYMCVYVNPDLEMYGDGKTPDRELAEHVQN